MHTSTPRQPERIDPAALPGVAGAAAWLVFRLGAEQFGIDARRARACVNYAMLGRVADGAASLKGVALWRGEAVALLDLRPGRGAAEPAPLTDVILYAGRERLVGVLVDAALDVVTLAPWQLGAMPPVPRRSAAGALIGSAGYGAGGLLLVDLDVLLADGARRRACAEAAVSALVPAG